MKQTAVEWFLTEFQKQVWFEPNSELDMWVKDLIPKAKEMEKEQMINIFKAGHLYSGCPFGLEQYYNETFNK
jgi:hypothetical protein